MPSPSEAAWHCGAPECRGHQGMPPVTPERYWAAACIPMDAEAAVTDDKCARVRCGLPIGTSDVVETPEGPRYHRECWEDMLDGIGAL